MDSRVASVVLHVRAPRAIASSASASAEAFATDVLRRCDEILERRSPGRVYVVRSLDICLRLLESALDDPREIEAVAAEVADALDARADGVEVRMFDSPLAWCVAHLECRATDPALLWPFDGLDLDESFHTVARAAPVPVIRGLIETLHRSDMLPGLLVSAPPDVVSAIAAAIGPAPATSPSGDAIASDSDLPADVIACARSLRGCVSETVAAICVTMAARQALGRFASDNTIAQVVQSALMHYYYADPPPVLARPRAADSAGDGEMSAVAPLTTGFGGIFYLLSLAMELSWGEHLWRACLPEGRVLAHAIATLLGEGGCDDAAPALFGGVDAGDAVAAIDGAQLDEIARAALGSFVAVVPRRGLAALRPPTLSLVDSAEGKLLVATADASSCAIFAKPARTREEIEDALNAFLSIWPRSAPRPRASRALALLDRRSRIQADPDTPNLHVYVGTCGSINERALVGQVAGTIVALWAARLNVPADHESIARYFRLPAQVRLTPEHMEVRMAMACIDLDVRRAGLDADPGWVPWLQRHVTIAFDLD